MTVRLGRDPALKPSAFRALVSAIRAVIRGSRFGTLDELGRHIVGHPDKRRLSDLAGGKRFPELHELRAVVKACNPQAWPEIEQQYYTACAEKTAADTAKPQLAVARPKRPIPPHSITQCDPIRQLGVHKAIHMDTAAPDLPALIPYVIRNHDYELREALRTRQGNQLVVLVGGSSVGKTRTCYEAVLEVLPGWPVLHPLTPEELLAILEGGIAPGTVLWLDETQRYLQPPQGRDVAVALRQLLSSAAEIGTDRVVILGAMWLSPYWREFTHLPEPGQLDQHPHVRDLLTNFCLRVDVAKDFHDLTDTQRRELQRLAEQDPRMTVAVAAGGDDARVTQVLAGGPGLLQHYADLEKASPVAHAVLAAAMDARCIGFESALPAELLAQAVAGYLMPAERAAQTGWFTAALDEATQEIHGVRALDPIRIDHTIGEPEAFVLHDYLAQHAVGRHREIVPTQLWCTLANHTRNPNDAARIAQAAAERLLYCHALRLQHIAGDENRDVLWLADLLANRGDAAGLREQANAGNRYAACRLAKLLLDQGDTNSALAMFRELLDAINTNDGWYAASRQAKLLKLLLANQDDTQGLRVQLDAGNAWDASRLADLLAEPIDVESVVAMLREFDAGNTNGPLQVAELLAKQGDINGLHDQADAGNLSALKPLADLHAQRGDIEGLRLELLRGNTYVADHLTTLVAAQNADAGERLRLYGLNADGTIPGHAGRLSPMTG